jgi:imidazolonepropionase-like amidohydrolase
MVNLAGEVGLIAAGKLADLVVWDNDPLADITVLQRPAEIFLIIKEGRIVVDCEAGGFRQLNEEPPSARMFLAG